MNFSCRGLWCMVIVVSAGVLGASGWTWVRSTSVEGVETRRLARLVQQSAELAELGGNVPEWALAPKTPGTLAPQVSSALSAAGLPTRVHCAST